MEPAVVFSMGSMAKSAPPSRTAWSSSSKAAAAAESDRPAASLEMPASGLMAVRAFLAKVDDDRHLGPALGGVGVGDERLLLLAHGVIEDLAEQASDVVSVEPGGVGLADEARQQIFLAVKVVSRRRFG